MSDKSKKRSRLGPQVPKGKSLDEFAAGATIPPGEEQGPATEPTAETQPPQELPKKEVVYPWEEPYVRDDVMKQMLLRLPEPYFLKLDHIASYTPYSKQSFVLEHLKKAIDKEIKKITG